MPLLPASLVRLARLVRLTPRHTICYTTIMSVGHVSTGGLWQVSMARASLSSCTHARAIDIARMNVRTQRRGHRLRASPYQNHEGQSNNRDVAGLTSQITLLVSTATCQLERKMHLTCAGSPRALLDQNHA